MNRTAFALVLLAALFACGGPAPIAPHPALVGDAGASPSAAVATTPPPAGLPPMSAMPPPGVAWSKKAKRRNVPACVSLVVADPVEQIKKSGETCGAANRMKAVGPPFRGQQSDKDPHSEHRFRVEANKCYRVYFATSADARDVVAVVRDSAGDIVAESPSTSVPDDAVMCFTTADEVSLLVGIGSGKGSYAAQVWSD